MTAHQQLWLTRLASIPALLFLPMPCTIMVALIVGWPKGDNFPTPVFLGFIIALIAVFPLARRTAFARLDRLVQAKRVLLGVLAFDALLFILGHVIKYFTHDA
jgi:hypothetical protein